MRKSSFLATPLKSLINEMGDHTARDALERVLEWLEELEDRVEKLESEK